MFNFDYFCVVLAILGRCYEYNYCTGNFFTDSSSKDQEYNFVTCYKNF